MSKYRPCTSLCNRFEECTCKMAGDKKANDLAHKMKCVTQSNRDLQRRLKDALTKQHEAMIRAVILEERNNDLLSESGNQKVTRRNSNLCADDNISEHNVRTKHPKGQECKQKLCILVSETPASKSIDKKTTNEHSGQCPCLLYKSLCEETPMICKINILMEENYQQRRKIEELEKMIEVKKKSRKEKLPQTTSNESTCKSTTDSTSKTNDPNSAETDVTASSSVKSEPLANTTSNTKTEQCPSISKCESEMLVRENSSLKDILKFSAKSHQEDVNNLEAQKKSLESQKIKLELRNRELSKTLKSSELLVDQLRKTLESLGSEFEGSRSRINNLTDSCTSYKIDANKYKALYEEACHKAAGLEKVLVDLYDKIKALELERSILLEHLREKTQKKPKLMVECCHCHCHGIEISNKLDTSSSSIRKSGIKSNKAETDSEHVLQKSSKGDCSKTNGYRRSNDDQRKSGNPGENSHEPESSSQSSSVIDVKSSYAVTDYNNYVKECTGKCKEMKTKSSCTFAKQHEEEDKNPMMSRPVRMSLSAKTPGQQERTNREVSDDNKIMEESDLCESSARGISLRELKKPTCQSGHDCIGAFSEVHDNHGRVSNRGAGDRESSNFIKNLFVRNH